MEGGAHWCATGLENLAIRKGKGSNPSLSAMEGNPCLGLGPPAKRVAV